MNKTILVIGGTGLLGMPTAKHLRQRGWNVRVMSRHCDKARQELDAEIELFPGNAENQDDLRRALEGCEAAHVSVANLPDWHLETRVVRTLLSLKESSALKRIGYISGASVNEERRSFAMIDAKLEAESLLKQHDVPYTVFRPSMIFETLPMMVRGARATIVGRQPLPAHWLAAEDLGSMIAKAFDTEEAANQVLYLYGPQALTMQDALQRYCDQIQPGLRVQHLPLWVLGVAARLQRNAKLRAVVDMMRYFETHGEAGDATQTQQLLGQPNLTLEDWCNTLATPERKAA